MKNPLKVMLVIVIVLVLGLIFVTLFMKQKVQLTDGTEGTMAYFPKKDTDTEPAPAPTPTEKTSVL